jgi:tRNA (guanosine-2'-O-)-methyltransferase
MRFGATYSGSNDWVNIHSYQTTKECIKALKDQNFKILVTDIENGSISYDTLEKEVIVPTLPEESRYAFVFGGERWGVTDEVCII